MPAGTATGIATGTDERGAYGYLVSRPREDNLVRADRVQFVTHHQPVRDAAVIVVKRVPIRRTSR